MSLIGGEIAVGTGQIGIYTTSLSYKFSFPHSFVRSYCGHALLVILFTNKRLYTASVHHGLHSLRDSVFHYIRHYPDIRISSLYNTLYPSPQMECCPEWSRWERESPGTWPVIAFTIICLTIIHHMGQFPWHAVLETYRRPS